MRFDPKKVQETLEGILERHRPSALRHIRESSRDASMSFQPEDEMTAVSEESVNLELARINDAISRAAERALQRLKAGCYGICTQCREDISTARLNAIPYAALCKECQDGAECRNSRRPEVAVYVTA